MLLTFKLDRLSRNLKDLLIFIDDELDPKGIALQSVTENFNTQSAEARLFLQMLGSFAEFERKRINERTLTGKVSTAKKGGWNGGHVPYGYQGRSSKEDIQTLLSGYRIPEDKEYYRLSIVLFNPSQKMKVGVKERIEARIILYSTICNKILAVDYYDSNRVRGNWMVNKNYYQSRKI